MSAIPPPPLFVSVHKFAGESQVKKLRQIPTPACGGGGGEGGRQKESAAAGFVFFCLPPFHPVHARGGKKQEEEEDGHLFFFFLGGAGVKVEGHEEEKEEEEEEEEENAVPSSRPAAELYHAQIDPLQSSTHRRPKKFNPFLFSFVSVHTNCAYVLPGMCASFPCTPTL